MKMPVEINYLERWLLDMGFAEEKPGYGHVDAKELAQALVNHFDIYQYIKEKFNG